MIVLIVDESSKAQIDILNESNSQNKIEPSSSYDGRLFVNADILTECGTNAYWSDYGVILKKLAIHRASFETHTETMGGTLLPEPMEFITIGEMLVAAKP